MFTSNKTSTASHASVQTCDSLGVCAWWRVVVVADDCTDHSKISIYIYVYNNSMCNLHSRGIMIRELVNIHSKLVETVSVLETLGKSPAPWTD